MSLRCSIIWSASAPFDAVSVMWGLRYLSDPVAVTRNLAGLLGEGGRLVIVEFVEPEPGVVSRAAGYYFFYVLPRIAGALAGHGELYRELTATTHAIGPAENLLSMVEAAGLEIAETDMMGFGLVCGIVATRR